ncbi:hypothetical protein F5J12DRAFT_830652 [Pisolithus orientalis]|uniref:uncharacterized protein n=1 Tax=Pisolithus orientalis TaxID=936130 RepID=UPI002225AFF7|nr:uncharacterized protein F5J12DRAFT_830652 [Pisolithus orientalis]KAI6007777.1 hypothetical protein F5J12DRAFT_830652 [Pisolithus orientalis]
MPLRLKTELNIWDSALKAYDKQNFSTSLELFSQIADSSKILTNMGLIYATIGKHEAAIEHFNAATNLDKFLAIAYFQCGVSNFLLGRYDAAYAKFQDAYLYLRGNRFINYEQLGLKFKLFSAEVLFNRGLSQLYLGYAKGMSDLEQARKEKEVIGHEVIDDVIRDRGGQYTVFSVPVGVLYHPSEKKLRNSKVKDYLGKAKLVIGSDLDDIYREFSGVTELKQNSDPSTSSPLESTSNADPKASLSGTPDRGATASIFRTRSIGPSPTTERSKTINGPLSTASHLSPIFPHRPRTPGSDAQPQSRQGRAARFTCLFPVPSLATMCCSIHRSSE